MTRYQKLLIAGIVVIAVIAVVRGPSFLTERRVLNETREYITEKYGEKDAALSVTQLITYSRAGISKTDVFEVRVRPQGHDANYLVIAHMKKSGIDFYDSKQIPVIKKAINDTFARLFQVYDNDISITIFGFHGEYSHGLNHPSGGVEYNPELLKGYFREDGDVFDFLGREQAYMWIVADTQKDFTEKDIEAMNDIGRKLFSSDSWGHLSLYRTINLNTDPRVYDGNLIQTDETYSISLSDPHREIETYYYNRNTMSEGQDGVLEP